MPFIHLASLVALSFFFIVSCESPEEKFDKETGQVPVLTRAGIDSVLASFETISYDELPAEYISYTNSDGEFYDKLKNETYYIIKGDDILKYVVGTYRIRHFMSTDKYFSKNYEDYSANYAQYWLTDKKMLYMLLDLVLALKEKGYNEYGFNVRESHRHPKLNRLKGGASVSQHIWGKAMDIVVEDINGDGKSNLDDKAIVLEIVEEVVGDKGGVGRYPGGQTVHFDSRGYGARWDSH